MAIPWKLLTRDGHALTVGDPMLLAIGVNWGSAAAIRSQADYTPPEHRFVDLINPDNPQREFIWQSTKAWGTVKFLPAGKLAPSPSLQQLSVVEQEIKREYSTEGPVALRYEMPYDGAATLVIEKPDGTRRQESDCRLSAQGRSPGRLLGRHRRRRPPRRAGQLSSPRTMPPAAGPALRARLWQPGQPSLCECRGHGELAGEP